jgi:ribonuclease HI
MSINDCIFLATLIQMTSQDIIIYTDGSCLDNGKSCARGGIGVYFGDDHNLNVSEPLLCPNPTNQIAELQAIDSAIEIVTCYYPGHSVEILSDSSYSINALTVWGDSWEKNGWKRAGNKPIKNLELIRSTRQRLKPVNVVFTHVRGHRGCYGNECADKLAVAGANKVVNCAPKPAKRRN